MAVARSPEPAGSPLVSRAMAPVATAAPFGFDAEALLAVADANAAAFASADPYPSIVLDGLFPDSALRQVAAGFPSPTGPGWRRHADDSQRKLQWADPAQLSGAPAAMLGLLQSAAWVRFLERLSGVEGLMPDPEFLHGGLHVIEPGGYLKIHSDHTFQERLWMVRRVNVILYLTEGWHDEWGGELELWDDEMRTCRKRIVPRFGRVVVFTSQPPAHHGHPDPTTSPAGVNRQSIAAYYYTSPAHPGSPASAPELDRFQARPGRERELDGHKFRRVVADSLLPAGVSRALRKRRARPQ